MELDHSTCPYSHNSTVNEAYNDLENKSKERIKSLRNFFDTTLVNKLKSFLLTSDDIVFVGLGSIGRNALIAGQSDLAGMFVMSDDAFEKFKELDKEKNILNALQEVMEELEQENSKSGFKLKLEFGKKDCNNKWIVPLVNLLQVQEVLSITPPKEDVLGYWISNTTIVYSKPKKNTEIVQTLLGSARVLVGNKDNPIRKKFKSLLKTASINELYLMETKIALKKQATAKAEGKFPWIKAKLGRPIQLFTHMLYLSAYNQRKQNIIKMLEETKKNITPIFNKEGEEYQEVLDSLTTLQKCWIEVQLLRSCSCPNDNANSRANKIYDLLKGKKTIKNREYMYELFNQIHKNIKDLCCKLYSIDDYTTITGDK